MLEGGRLTPQGRGCQREQKGVKTAKGSMNEDQLGLDCGELSHFKELGLSCMISHRQILEQEEPCFVFYICFIKRNLCWRQRQNQRPRMMMRALGKQQRDWCGHSIDNLLCPVLSPVEFAFPGLRGERQVSTEI